MTYSQQMPSGKHWEPIRRERIAHLAQFLTEHNDLAGLLNQMSASCLKDLSIMAERYQCGEVTSNKVPDGDQPTRQRDQAHEHKPDFPMIPDETTESELFDDPIHQERTVTTFGTHWRLGSMSHETWSVKYIESSQTWYVRNNYNRRAIVIEGYSENREAALRLIRNYAFHQRVDGGLIWAVNKIESTIHG